LFRDWDDPGYKWDEQEAGQKGKESTKKSLKENTMAKGVEKIRHATETIGTRKKSPKG